MAQSFRAIPSTGALFRHEQHYSVVGPGISTSFPFLQYTAGDTLIDSLTVTKVIFDDPPYWCHCINPYDTNYCKNAPETYDWAVAYLLQDTLAGKVYWMMPGAPPVLQFDFAAMPGDSIHTSWVPGNPTDTLTYVVDSVDTVTYVDGIERRRLWLHHYYAGISNVPRVWVEGIGDLRQGLLPQADVQDGLIVYAHFTALCYQEGGVDLTTGLLPPTTCVVTSPCDLVTARPKPMHEEEVRLKGNPSEVLRLEGLRQPAQVTILTPLGQTVFEAISDAEGTVHGTEKLTEGTYLVRVSLDDQVETHHIWVKTR